jgi:hypothetical protein
MPRPRTPNRIKVLKGTDQPVRMHPEPELPNASDLSPLEWLCGSDAVDLWHHLTGLLAPVRVLSEGDKTALGHLANLHGRCVRLWRAGESPTAAELTQLRLYLTEFGLTPASRSKAGQIGEAPDANPFLKLEKSG